MAHELFSPWGGITGWRSQRPPGFEVSATVAGISLHYTARTAAAVDRAFYRACARAFFRRFLPFLAPPPAELHLPD